jgi:hypothetical protein
MGLMEFIVGILAGVLISFIVIVLIAQALARARIRYIEHKIDEGIKAFREHVIDSRIELVSNQLFLYNKKTDEFLAQGKDLQELNDNASKRFPDKLFNVPNSELIKYEQVNK